MKFTDKDKYYLGIFITQALSSQSPTVVVDVFTQLLDGDPVAVQQIIDQLNAFLDSLILVNQTELGNLDAKKLAQEQVLKDQNTEINDLKQRLAQP